MDFNDMLMGTASGIIAACALMKRANINRVQAWYKLPVLYELDAIQWDWRK